MVIKNIQKLVKSKLFNYILVISIILVLTINGGLIYKSTENKSPFLVEVSPFQIIDDTRIIFEGNSYRQEMEEDKRLAVSIEIMNNTVNDYEDVWFELQLNPEIEPFLASHISRYVSEKMDVTTKTNALSQKDIDENNQQMPLVSGFVHEWEILLTSDEILNEYYGVTFDDIQSALKDISVYIYWNGGKQEEHIPVILSSSATDLSDGSG